MEGRTHLADVEDLHLAFRVPGGNLLAGVGPSDAVQRCSSVHKHTGGGNLRHSEDEVVLEKTQTDSTSPKLLLLVSTTVIITSVSLFRFHRSRRPARSTQANIAGCVGDHMESLT